MAGQTSSRPRTPAVPAWALSVAIHVGVLIALVGAINSEQHGSPNAKRGSMGIVITHSGDDGPLSSSFRPKVQQAIAYSDVPAPPLLLASTNVEVKEPAPTEQQTPTPTPKPAASSKTPTKGTKAAPKQAKPGGKSNGRPSGVVGSSGSDGYGQTSVFGVQGKGSKFIYVFDRSASMEGKPLAAAKQQLLQSLQSLDTVQQFHIIFFNTRTQSFDVTEGGRRIAFASDRNKKLAANFIGGITADGGTDRMYALREALNFAPDVIFFLTDADDAMSASEMAELVRLNRRVQASICVIEFGNGPPKDPNDFLARLAHDNGGQYGYVDTAKLK